VPAGYYAILFKTSGARASDLVAVFGIGGLGHVAVQYAKAAGASVVAVDVIPDQLELAKQLGADYTVDASSEDPVSQIQALGGADVALGLCPVGSVLGQGYASLRRGGRLMLVRSLLGRDEFCIPVHATAANEISVVGSAGGTRVDLREEFELHEKGYTRVVREVRLLRHVNEALAELEAGSVSGRVVFEVDVTRIV
jgi:propanol-preferring alcohol dehydrogenase